MEQRDFIRALVIFVLMAIVGTGFGLWFTMTFAPEHPAPSTLDSRR